MTDDPILLDRGITFSELNDIHGLVLGGQQENTHVQIGFRNILLGENGCVDYDVNRGRIHIDLPEYNPTIDNVANILTNLCGLSDNDRISLELTSKITGFESLEIIGRYFHRRDELLNEFNARTEHFMKYIERYAQVQQDQLSDVTLKIIRDAYCNELIESNRSTLSEMEAKVRTQLMRSTNFVLGNRSATYQLQYLKLFEDSEGEKILGFRKVLDCAAAGVRFNLEALLHKPLQLKQICWQVEANTSNNTERAMIDYCVADTPRLLIVPSIDLDGNGITQICSRGTFGEELRYLQGLKKKV
jgi:hypothetical protein